jgi:hypothetical protein
MVAIYIVLIFESAEVASRGAAAALIITQAT